MKDLGKVSFAGQRVLEIGPASGFLTFEMEKRGAEVVSIEVTPEHGWNFVPYPAKRLEEVFGSRRIVMQQLKNSYWFSHAALQSKPRCITAMFTICLPPSDNRHSSHGLGVATLPRPAPNCRAMRKNRPDAYHCGHVSPGPGRRARLPPRADATEFPVAYVVAFQYTIFYSIFSGDGI